MAPLFGPIDWFSSSYKIVVIVCKFRFGFGFGFFGHRIGFKIKRLGIIIRLSGGIHAFIIEPMGNQIPYEAAW
jgi:hypothetical protein